MKRILHAVYMGFGHLQCAVWLTWWRLRDWISPPKETAVLFVAHPDDDTLFFYTFIQKEKPYVALMTAGWSLRRLPCFFKAMRKYGVRFRAYDMGTRDRRTDLLEKHVREVFQHGSFKFCATHNSEGEYGHEMHKRVHDAVIKNAKCEVLVPEKAERIIEYPLPKEVVETKEKIFRDVYTTELFVLEEYKEWVENEHLVKE